jgi:hypothetical protein
MTLPEGPLDCPPVQKEALSDYGLSVESLSHTKPVYRFVFSETDLWTNLETKSSLFLTFHLSDIIQKD